MFDLKEEAKNRHQLRDKHYQDVEGTHRWEVMGDLQEARGLVAWVIGERIVVRYVARARRYEQCRGSANTKTAQKAGAVRWREDGAEIIHLAYRKGVPTVLEGLMGFEGITEEERVL